MNFTYERRINYYETDKMGIVHHSNYIRFLEEARCAFLDNIGIPYKSIEDAGLMIPVLCVNCKFKHHVTFDDIILIKVSVKDFNGVRLIISYEVTDKNTNDLVLTGETTHCFTDDKLKPINIKKHYPEIFKKFETQ